MRTDSSALFFCCLSITLTLSPSTSTHPCRWASPCWRWRAPPLWRLVARSLPWRSWRRWAVGTLPRAPTSAEGSAARCPGLGTAARTSPPWLRAAPGQLDGQSPSPDTEHPELLKIPLRLGLYERFKLRAFLRQRRGEDRLNERCRWKEVMF